jgi:hypothetical protein
MNEQSDLSCNKIMSWAEEYRPREKFLLKDRSALTLLPRSLREMASGEAGTLRLFGLPGNIIRIFLTRSPLTSDSRDTASGEAGTLQS